MTFGWQQLDVNEAEIGLFEAPWLKAATLRVPLLFSRDVMDKSPSPESLNVTCAAHVLERHSGLLYTPVHEPLWLVILHDGGERSGAC